MLAARLFGGVAVEVEGRSVPPLGRPRGAGVELRRVLAERAVLFGAASRVDESLAAASEARRLADARDYDGYRERLAAVPAAAPAG